MTASDLDERIATQLPPRPDAETGEPRPPSTSTGRAAGPGPRSGVAPEPPPNRGPALEWHRRVPFHWLLVVLFVTGTGTFLYLMLFGGYSWSVPDGWLAVAVWTLFVAGGLRDGFRNRAARISAGADWLRVGGRRWVDLYDLERVELRGGVLNRSIVFRDSDGRRVSASVGFLQHAPALRDLVVNGVRHSWHRGASVDEDLCAELDLDNGPAWRWFEPPGRRPGRRDRRERRSRARWSRRTARRNTMGHGV